MFPELGIAAMWYWMDRIADTSPHLRHVLDHRLWHDSNAMIAIGGELCTGQLCWYADIVTDATDPEYMKRYVGQAEIDFHRFSPHLVELSFCQNDESLHYWIGTQENRQSNLIAMHMNSTVIDMLYKTEPEEDTTIKSLMFLVEMYFCLQFRTLPKGHARVVAARGIRRGRHRSQRYRTNRHQL